MNLFAPYQRFNIVVARLAVIGVAALSVGLSIAGIPMRFQAITWLTNAFQPNIPSTISPQFCALFIIGLEVSLAFIFFVTAAILLWRRLNDRMVLLLAGTLFAVGATETGLTDALINPTYSSAWLVWQWPVWTMRALALTSGLILLYILPDGHFRPTWTKWLAIVWAGLNLIWLIFPDIPFNTIYGPTWRATPLASLLIALAWFSTGLYAQWYRYHFVSDVVQRQQTRWVAYGLAAAVLSGVGYYGIWTFNYYFAAPPGIPALLYLVGRPALSAALMALLPICLGVAVLRYRLFDIDLIINRTLVYGLLTASTLGIYIVLTVGLGRWLQTDNDSVTPFLATGVVAVLFNPIRQWLQRGVNRLLFGWRNEPYAVLSALGQRLEATFEPSLVLPTLVETVAQTLKLPYVAITLKQDDQFILAAAHGQVQSVTERLPFRYANETIGELILAPRSPSEAFTTADRQLLSDLARQAGVAAHAVQLTADLTRSRMQIVTEREEARRRLGNDLHDGLGHRLAGVLRRSETAIKLLEQEPMAVHAHLTDIRQQARAAIDEVRHLAHALHPPELELLGLVGALQEQIQQINGAGQLQILFEPANPLIKLPISLEAAAYYIALEALTNIERHANAHQCRVRLSLSENTALHAPMLAPLPLNTLELEIIDDGIGLSNSARHGLGLASMRNRALELGGTFNCSVVSSGGTRISAWLPVYEDYRL